MQCMYASVRVCMTACAVLVSDLSKCMEKVAALHMDVLFKINL